MPYLCIMGIHDVILKSKRCSIDLSKNVLLDLTATRTLPKKRNKRALEKNLPIIYFSLGYV
ncbi:hypothetical protein UACE39S_04337 [Ureibacillus acetophenoni]